MRMVKMKPQQLTLDGAIQKFLLVKKSQHTGEETMKDYQNCLSRFLQHSRNSLDEAQLENDVLTFFAAIPDTSPARYNKPFQNINALLNWLVEQGHISKNPIKVHKLRKRRDDGNIKPASVEALQQFLSSLDQGTYTGLRDYVICMVMLDTGIRTKELLSLRNDDNCISPFLFHLCDHSMTAINRNGKSAEMIIPSKVIWILLCNTYKFCCK